MMKKYKVRIYGLGIDATAIIPFDNEPTQEILENNVAYYLNNNLMKITQDSFFSNKKAAFTTVLPLENIIASTFRLEMISIVSSGSESGHLVSYAATSNTREPAFLNWSAIKSLPPVWTLGTKTRSP